MRLGAILGALACACGAVVTPAAAAPVLLSGGGTLGQDVSRPGFTTGDLSTVLLSTREQLAETDTDDGSTSSCARARPCARSRPPRRWA